MLADDAAHTLDFSKLEDRSYDDCLALLSTAKVGRLAFVESGDPVVLPVNFAMDGSRVVFRTGRGSKLSAAVMHAPVCLEIDHWDEASRTGWSILAKGFSEHVTGPETERFEVLHSALHVAVQAVVELSDGEIVYLE